MNIAAYKDTTVLFEGKNVEIIRAQHADGSFVILKSIKPSALTRHAINKHRHEFEILRKIQSPRVIKAVSLTDEGSSIVFEDFNGTTLTTLLSMDLSIKELLLIAIELSQGLGEIHHHEVIHKDIKPNNLLIHLPSHQIKYIDFDIATLLSREMQQVSNFNALESSLAYISPEQTGRMNRPLDYRTDFYSLGVTLYQLFTHHLPFESENPVDVMHMHIAKQASPPHVVNATIPKGLSDVIMKCLAKDADDRYRSAFGLKNDLEKCLEQWMINHEIEPFPLGQQDFFDHFQLPTKLYGREEEINVLMSCYQKAAQGSLQILMVNGYAGIGKTSLINEIQRPIVQEKGYFVSGKYEQYKKHTPYHGLIEILKNLTKQLLLESEERLAQWKTDILQAVGFNGQVLVDIIPEIHSIIGPQLPVSKMDIQATEARFQHIEALTYERLIHFYLALGFTNKALQSLNEAINKYILWGSAGKAKALKKEHHKLLEDAIFSGQNQQILLSGTYSVDVSKVLAVLQNISKEIVYDKLITKVMDLIIKAIEPDRAFFILKEQGELIVKAHQELNQNQRSLVGLFVDECHLELSINAINFAMKTHEFFLLNEITEQGVFVSDAYIRNQQIQAIMVIPITHQKKLIGLFYLENRTTKKIFLEEQVHQLKLISSQIAISIENAKLYKELENKNKRKNY